MNTKEIAAEYRLSHWAGIVREREESGLSIRAFCAGSGFHENIYYYLQKKLREATCTELAEKAARSNLHGTGKNPRQHDTLGTCGFCRGETAGEHKGDGSIVFARTQ